MSPADARTLRLALGYEADELLHAGAAHCAAEIIKGSAGTVSDELISQHCGKFRRRLTRPLSRARGSDNGVTIRLMFYRDWQAWASMRWSGVGNPTGRP